MCTVCIVSQSQPGVILQFPPPMPEVPAPFNVYRDQLTSQSHGLALWNPNPPKKLHENVMIGDVGYLCEGTFIRMFNVMLPCYHPLNGMLGKPEFYKSLHCDLFANIKRCHFDRAEYYSHVVFAETKASSKMQAIKPNK